MSERAVPLRLCVTIVCTLAAVACTFMRVPGNVACALVCAGLIMSLPDVMIDLPKTADELLAEALEENKALKALLKSELSDYSDTESDSDSTDTEGSDRSDRSDGSDGTESDASKVADSVKSLA